MSRKTAKATRRVYQENRKDDAPFYIAITAFVLIVLSAFFGKVFRIHAEDGWHPLPWVPYAVVGVPTVLVGAALYRDYRVRGFFRQFIPREPPV